MRKAVIYLNATKDQTVNDKAVELLERYCQKNDMELVASFGEDSNGTGMSFPSKFACIGIAVEEEVDCVVTVSAEMIGNNSEDIINTLQLFAAYDLSVETLAEDIELFYKEMYSEESAGDEETMNVILAVHELLGRE